MQQTCSGSSGALLIYSENPCKSPVNTHPQYLLNACYLHNRPLQQPICQPSFMATGGKWKILLNRALRVFRGKLVCGCIARPPTEPRSATFWGSQPWLAFSQTVPRASQNFMPFQNANWLGININLEFQSCTLVLSMLGSHPANPPLRLTLLQGSL